MEFNIPICPCCQKHELTFLYLAHRSLKWQVWPCCNDCGWELYFDEGRGCATSYALGLDVVEFEERNKDIYQKVKSTKSHINN